MAGHGLPFIKSIEKVWKATTYININIYKKVNPLKWAWMQFFDICSYRTEIHFSGYSLKSQIQTCITPLALRQNIRNAWDALRTWSCVKGKKIWEVEAECYNNCVFSLPTDLGKENGKKKKYKRPELIKEKKMQVVILVTSRGLFENVQKERKQKRGKTKIRGSNIAMNWHS